MGSGTSSMSTADEIRESLSSWLTNVGVENVSDENLVSNFGTIKFESIDMMKELNAKEHSTSAYDIPDLVLRRGQSFEFQVKLQDASNFVLEKMTCRLKLLDNGNTISILSSKQNDGNFGSIRIQSFENEVLTVVATFSPTTPIGRYFMEFRITHGARKGVYNIKNTALILFNPWCETDMVYMKVQEEREEYVLNEQGFVYRSGGRFGVSPTVWNYDQFDAEVLEATLFLVNSIPIDERKSSIFLARRLSALANAADENGVLVGNWSGNYEGGTAPFKWTGSQRILAQYIKHKKPVKYGQCWVFAGVLTTLNRAVGIPCRPVTNYSSAHDTDANRTIDYYYDENMNRLEETADSIWNFHVWNESWMRRPDLVEGRGGWQAIDATPQETSNGIYQLGPASIVSIKKGEKGPYDNEFVIAEVNADIKLYQLHENGTFVLRRVITDNVGKKIVTKAVNSNGHEDITLKYKHAEGTVPERLQAMHKLQNGDVQFEVGANDAHLGSSMEVKFAVSGEADRKVKYHILFYSRAYHGRYRVKLHEIKVDDPRSIPFEETISITPDMYQLALKDTGCWFQCELSAIVEGTNQSYRGEETFDLKLPEDIQVEWKSSDKLAVSMETEATVIFKNPFPDMVLTNGLLQIESSSRYFEYQEIGIREVAGGEKIEIPIVMTPKDIGKARVNFELDFDQITDLQLFEEVEIV